MKGYYEATRKKPQTVGEFLKKASERNYASDQIYKHNMKEGTTKLKMVKDTIHYQNGGGWTAFNMLHDPIMEMNALEAIRMVTPARSHSIYPSLAQIYSVRRADERAILQNHENLNREVFLTPELKTKLLKYKKESLDMYEKDHHWTSDENYDTVLDKEYAEIQWLEMFRGAQNDFFNSEYVRGFGLVFQYKPLPLPQAPNPNPEPNPDEEDAEMLKELRAQLEQMRQEIENKNNDLADKDKTLVLVTQERDQAIIERNEAVEQVADRDRIIEDKDLQLQTEKDTNSDLTDKLATEKILTKELTDKNSDLTNQVEHLNGKVNDLANKLNISEEKNTVLQNDLKISEAKVKPLEEKVTDLKHYNKQLEDDKIELRENNKDLREDKKLYQEEKKALIDEKKYYFGLSTEQANKIDLLEQVHCNVLEHEYMNVKPTGDMSVQTD